MKFCGLQRCTFVDFPGRSAFAVFTQGCNLRCPYCHNLDTLRRADPTLPRVVDLHLERRRGLLKGVVVTGGEPTLQRDLLPFLGRCKDLGYAVKLDTNGTNPAALRAALLGNLVDYVAMDIKAPWPLLEEVAGTSVDFGALEESIEILTNAAIATEFRTTVLPGFTPGDIRLIAEYIRGSKRYALQQYTPKPGDAHERLLQGECWSVEALQSVARDLSSYIGEIVVRS